MTNHAPLAAALGRRVDPARGVIDAHQAFGALAGHRGSDDGGLQRKGGRYTILSGPARGTTGRIKGISAKQAKHQGRMKEFTYIKYDKQVTPDEPNLGLMIEADRLGDGQLRPLDGCWCSKHNAIAVGDTHPGAFGCAALHLKGADQKAHYRFSTHYQRYGETNGTWHVRFWAKAKAGHPKLTVSTFRDDCVAMLRTYGPGCIRYLEMGGSTLDNVLAPPLARHAYSSQRGSKVGPYERHSRHPYSLHEMYVLCEHLGCDPWYTLPGTLSQDEMKRFMEYLGAPSDVGYGKRRAELGHPKPWTEVFRTVHVELGNEAWNNAGPYQCGGVAAGQLYVRGERHAVSEPAVAEAEHPVLHRSRRQGAVRGGLLLHAGVGVGGTEDLDHHQDHVEPRLRHRLGHR